MKECLRYMERFRDTEEMVHACEPEAGRNLSDDDEQRSLEYLRDYQVSTKEISIFQMGNNKRT